MEKIKNKQSFFEKPKLRIIHFTEMDIITASGDPFKDEEGEFIPAKVDNLFR